jgi:hypothetical protein
MLFQESSTMTRSYLRRFTTLLAALFVLWGATTAWAQDTTAEPPEATAESTETPISDLSYNSPVIGHIDNNEMTQTWPLQTASADRITVRVERLDGNLLPNVVIQDANGTELNNAYGAGSLGSVSQISGYLLPAAGTYQIQVQREGGDTGVTEGRYRLIVIPNATADDNINNTTVMGPIDADTSVEGEITGTHWYQRYTYTAAAPDTIRIIVERTNGTYIPEIDVLDANGTAITSGYEDGTGARAVIDQFTLPASGPFIIGVTRDGRFNGVTEGSYRLTVEMVGSGEGSPNLEGITGTVEYDTPLQGEITPTQWYQDWTITAAAGDTLTLRAERTGGTLRPEVILLGGSGQEINHGYIDYSGAFAAINGYTLTGPGTYTVRVTRENYQRGVTSGAYTLNVMLLGAGEDSPSLTEPSGTVAKGEPVEGEVTAARWADTWTFSGTEGQAIQVDVQRTSGTLIPMVEIRDQNGQSLATGYYGASKDSVTLTYTPTATGEYQIVVERERGQTGETTGAYTLAISQPQQ